jgi:hypothetical protein
LGTNFNINLGVPFLLKAGNVSHFASLQVGYGSTDNSTGSVVTYSTKEGPGALGPYNNTNTSVATTSSSLAVGGSYALLMPAIFSKGKDDKFIADADFSVTFAGSNYSSTNTSATFNAAGGGAAPVPGTLTSTTAARTYNPGIGWKLGAGAIHSFYFAPGTGVQLGVVPTVYVDYSMTVPNASLASQTTDVLTDNNNNGKADAGDTIAHTTLAFTNASAPGTATTTTGLVEVFASLPMAIVIKPTGWVFGFTLGTAPTLLFQNSSLYTYAKTQTTKTSTTTVGGATTAPVLTTQVTTDPSTQVTNAWTFTAQHKFSLNFDFGNGVTMDVILNAQNLFVFDNLSIQVNAALK